MTGLYKRRFLGKEHRHGTEHRERLAALVGDLPESGPGGSPSVAGLQVGLLGYGDHTINELNRGLKIPNGPEIVAPTGLRWGFENTAAPTTEAGMREFRLAAKKPENAPKIDAINRRELRTSFVAKSRPGVRYLINDGIVFPTSTFQWNQAIDSIVPELSADEGKFLLEAREVRETLASWATGYATRIQNTRGENVLRNFEVSSLKPDVARVNGNKAALRGLLYAMYPEASLRAELDEYLAAMPEGNADALMALRYKGALSSALDAPIDAILDFVKRQPVTADQDVRARMGGDRRSVR